jgi:hypothetical protein
LLRRGEDYGAAGAVTDQMDALRAASTTTGADLQGQPASLQQMVVVVNLVDDVAPVAVRPNNSLDPQRGGCRSDNLPETFRRGLEVAGAIGDKHDPAGAGKGAYAAQ